MASIEVAWFARPKAVFLLSNSKEVCSPLLPNKLLLLAAGTPVYFPDEGHMSKS